MFADRAMPSVLAPALRASFGLSDTQIGGLIGTAMIVPFAFATIAAGHLFARSSPYRVMGFSVLCWTIAVAVGAMARTYPEMLLARIAFGIAQAPFAPAALALIAGTTYPHPAIGTSVFSTGSASGRSGGLLIGGLLLWLASLASLSRSIEPWRLASLWLLLPNLALAAALLARSSQDHALGPPRGSGMNGALRWISRHPRAFACHFIATAGALTIVQAGGAWAPSLISRTAGLDPARSAIMFGIIVLIGAPIGHLGAGQLAGRHAFDHRGPGIAMAASAVASLIFCALFMAVTGPIASAFALGGLVVCGGFAGAIGLIGLQPMVPGEHRLAAVSLFLAATTMTGYGVGPLLTGMLSDSFGGGGLGAALTMVVAGSAIVTCLAALGGSARWRAAVLEGRIARVVPAP